MTHQDRRTAYREVNASFAPSATNEPANTSRVQVFARGREITWVRPQVPSRPRSFPKDEHGHKTVELPIRQRLANLD